MLNTNAPGAALPAPPDYETPLRAECFIPLGRMFH